VLTLINNKEFSRAIITRETGAVILNDMDEKPILKAWQNRKKDEIITHS
jgi:hypothetical protein